MKSAFLKYSYFHLCHFCRCHFYGAIITCAITSSHHQLQEQADSLKMPNRLAESARNEQTFGHFLHTLSPKMNFLLSTQEKYNEKT